MSSDVSSTESRAYICSFTHCLVGFGANDYCELRRHPEKADEVVNMFINPQKEQKKRRNSWSKGRYTMVEDLPGFIKEDCYMRASLREAQEKGLFLGINEGWLAEYENL